MIWDGSKAVVRGYFIQYNHKMKKKSQENMQNVLGEFKRKESTNIFCYFISN